jgi:hypothetical protein
MTRRYELPDIAWIWLPIYLLKPEALGALESMIV